MKMYMNKITIFLCIILSSKAIAMNNNFQNIVQKNASETQNLQNVIRAEAQLRFAQHSNLPISKSATPLSYTLETAVIRHNLGLYSANNNKK